MINQQQQIGAIRTFKKKTRRKKNKNKKLLKITIFSLYYISIYIMNPSIMVSLKVLFDFLIV